MMQHFTTQQFLHAGHVAECPQSWTCSVQILLGGRKKPAIHFRFMRQLNSIQVSSDNMGMVDRPSCFYHDSINQVI